MASIAGVAFAATLVFAQVGMYVGFLTTSSAIIQHAKGDVWVMARGTQVLENGELLSGGVRSSLEGHPCVARVRELLLRYSGVRKPNSAVDSVQLVGFEPVSDIILPWNIVQGLPNDLHAPSRIAVDLGNLKKLQIEEHPLGAELELAETPVYVGAVTEGVRSFTLLPNIFGEIQTIRRLANVPNGQANYFIADLRSPDCESDVIRFVERNPEIQALPAARFAKMTQEYWVDGSGAGAALLFSALLGLVVGTVIVGQTLYSITKEHQRELGTLKAIGATGGELAQFVAWQALFLAIVGALVGFLLAYIIAHSLYAGGLTIILSPKVIGLGVATIFGMCAVASIGSIRKVIALEALEVFK